MPATSTWLAKGNAVSEFLLQYGLFFAKTITLVAALVLLIVLVMFFSGKSMPQRKDRLEICKLNDKYDEIQQSFQATVLDKNQLKQAARDAKQKQKQINKQADRKRIYVLNFDGDIKASAVQNLREEITALLTVVRGGDEVFLRLTSSGGLVHSYGLAASQLMRFRDRGIALTVAVDKVAASGGYMMACVGNRIIAAPFAILGSIGVVAQLPNFNRLLKKHDVDFEQFTAGEYKRTVTLFGENTDAARGKFKDEIEQTHGLFKQFVIENRPQLDIDRVANGEHWYGTQALALKLVDELLTSDDFMYNKSKEADLYEVTYSMHKGITERFGKFMSDNVARLFS